MMIKIKKQICDERVRINLPGDTISIDVWRQTRNQVFYQIWNQVWVPVGMIVLDQIHQKFENQN